jgi:DNA-binding XRE family transcriptional regulator
LAEEEAIRRQHAAAPLRQPPATAISQENFSAILTLLAKFKTERDKQGLTSTAVATQMGISESELVNLESGKTLNPSLATLIKWAQALGKRLDVDLKVD